MLNEWECYGCWGVDTGRRILLESDLSVDVYYEDLFKEALSALHSQGSSTTIARPLALKVEAEWTQKKHFKYALKIESIQRNPNE